ncbi:exonuclease domain-containing protein [Candidatus Vidania fulgoroideorum]
MKRLISLDTETTGLNTKYDRIIEIACVEILENRITGKIFHSYINTERQISEESYKIHKIKKNMLLKKPYFKDIGNKILEMVKQSSVIIHNAKFDYNIIKEEYLRIKKNIHFKVIDTYSIAKKKFPGKKNSLKMLCKRFKVKQHVCHSALHDAINLAKVFILMNPKQKKMPLKKKKNR